MHRSPARKAPLSLAARAPGCAWPWHSPTQPTILACNNGMKGARMTTNGPGTTGGSAQRQPGGASPPSLAGTLATSPRKARPGPGLVPAGTGCVPRWCRVAGIRPLRREGTSRRLPAGAATTQGELISLNHNGGYVLYYDTPGAASGQLPSFNVTVAPAAPAASAPSLRPYTADVTYSFGSRQGRAVLGFSRLPIPAHSGW